MSGLKDDLLADLDLVFLASEEFAEEHTFRGQVLLCVVDTAADMAASAGASGLRNASALGLLAEGCTVLAKARDVDPMPAPGEQVEFDGALWLVGDDVSETGGLAHIPLERAL